MDCSNTSLPARPARDHAAPDNPDIFDYYGYGEIKLQFQQTIRLHHSPMFRRGDTPDRYGFEFRSDFMPFERFNLKLFAQYWSGYGESLKDYNRRTSGLVAGLSAIY